MAPQTPLKMVWKSPQNTPFSRLKFQNFLGVEPRKSRFAPSTFNYDNLEKNGIFFQVIQFAYLRSDYASFIASSELVVKKLYLKGWTPDNDNTECSYGIYTIDQFYDAVGYAHKRYIYTSFNDILTVLVLFILQLQI